MTCLSMLTALGWFHLTLQPVLLLQSLQVDSHISAINLNFIKENTSKILAVTPIPYLKSPILKGGLFQEDPESGVISSIFTQFFVDHDEPLQVLEEYKNRKEWPLGDLLKGHEFVILVEMMPSV